MVFRGETPQIFGVARYERARHPEAQLLREPQLIELVLGDGDAVDGIDPGNFRIPDEPQGEVTQLAANKSSLAGREVGDRTRMEGAAIPDRSDRAQVQDLSRRWIFRGAACLR